jgi:hypothetical protein
MGSSSRILEKDAISLPPTLLLSDSMLPICHWWPGHNNRGKTINLPGQERAGAIIGSRCLSENPNRFPASISD